MFSFFHTPPPITIMLAWLVVMSMSTVYGAIHAEHPSASELVTTHNNNSFPLVSVMILTTLRGGRASLLLPLALEQLDSQTYENKEAVVVVQAPKSKECDEETLRVLATLLPSSDKGRRRRLFPVRMFCSLAPDATLGAMRNQAVAEALGEIVAHWDDDDVFNPERLALQVGQLLAGEKGVAGSVVALNVLPLSVLFDVSRDQFVKFSRTVGDLATLVYWRWLAVAHPYGDTSFNEEMAFVSGSLANQTVSALVLDRYTSLSLFIRVRHPRSATADIMSPKSWNNAEPLALNPAWIDENTPAQRRLAALIAATKRLALEPVEETAVPGMKSPFLNTNMGLAATVFRSFAREHHLVSQRVHAPSKAMQTSDIYEALDALMRTSHGQYYSDETLLADVVPPHSNGDIVSVVQRVAEYLVARLGDTSRNVTVFSTSSLVDLQTVLLDTVDMLNKIHWIQHLSNRAVIQSLGELAARNCEAFDRRLLVEDKSARLAKDGDIRRTSLSERSAVCWRDVSMIQLESDKYSNDRISMALLVRPLGLPSLFEFDIHLIDLTPPKNLIYSQLSPSSSASFYQNRHIKRGTKQLYPIRNPLKKSCDRLYCGQNCFVDYSVENFGYPPGGFGCNFVFSYLGASWCDCLGCQHCGGDFGENGACPTLCGTVNNPMCSAGGHRVLGKNARFNHYGTPNSNCLECPFCSTSPPTCGTSCSDIQCDVVFGWKGAGCWRYANLVVPGVCLGGSVCAGPPRTRMYCTPPYRNVTGEETLYQISSCVSTECRRLDMCLPGSAVSKNDQPSEVCYESMADGEGTCLPGLVCGPGGECVSKGPTPASPPTPPVPVPPPPTPPVPPPPTPPVPPPPTPPVPVPPPPTPPPPTPPPPTPPPTPNPSSAPTIAPSPAPSYASGTLCDSIGDCFRCLLWIDPSTNGNCKWCQVPGDLSGIGQCVGSDVSVCSVLERRFTDVCPTTAPTSAPSIALTTAVISSTAVAVSSTTDSRAEFRSTDPVVSFPTQPLSSSGSGVIGGIFGALAALLAVAVAVFFLIRRRRRHRQQAITTGSNEMQRMPSPRRQGSRNRTVSRSNSVSHARRRSLSRSGHSVSRSRSGSGVVDSQQLSKRISKRQSSLGLIVEEGGEYARAAAVAHRSPGGGDYVNVDSSAYVPAHHNTSDAASGYVSVGSSELPQLYGRTPGGVGVYSNVDSVAAVPVYQQLQLGPDDFDSRGDSVRAQARYVIGPGQLTKQKQLGSGQFGEVWKCDWKGVPVAMKMVKGVDRAAKKQLELEARRFQALPNHPHVVTFYGIVLDPLSIVIEFCSGGALDEALYGQRARRSFETSALHTIVRGIVLGVAHLHEHGIVHRDLAARNVLLGPGDVPKVTDFGMSRESQQQRHTLTTLGPVKWMAPEQLTEQAVSQAADVYAVGVVMYEVFARAKPWANETNVGAARRVTRGDHLPIPPGTPHNVGEAMQQCFKFAPEQRPSARTLVQTLADTSDGVTPAAAAPVCPSSDADYQMPPESIRRKHGHL